MVKKNLFISLALFGLLFSTMPPACFADASAQLEQAETYKQNEQYEQAEAIYRGIVTDYPGTDEAFQAQKNLALLYIKTARYPAARQEVDALLTNFADHPELPGEVYNLAEQYWSIKRKRYEDAKSLYEYIAENHSDSDLAIKARAWAAGADILLGNDAAAQAGIDALIRDFAEDPELARVLLGLGNINWNHEKYNWSRQLYQHTFERDPQGPLAIKAKAGAARSDILLGNDAAAQAGIDALIRDFAEDPGLAGVLFGLGNYNWRRNKYNWSRQLYQHTFERDPQGPLAMQAKARVARADILLGNDALAQSGIDALIRDFAEDLGLAGVLFGLGNYSWRRNKYNWSRQLYQHTFERDPQGPLAMQAKARVAKADILLGNDALAQSGIDALIRDFAEDPELAGVLLGLGNNMWKVFKKYNWSRQLYQHTFETDPQGPLAMQAKAGAARADILLGNDAAAQAGIDAVIRDFAEDPELAGVLLGLGNDSWSREKYDWAAELYQYVIDNWPKTEHEMRAKTGIAKLNISLGNDADTQAAIDSLIADFNDHPRLPWAVFVIGEEYYNDGFRRENEGLDAEAKDSFTKAIAVWERIITQLPESQSIDLKHAYYFSAVCYRRIGEYEKAIEYYQEVVVNWPDYQFAWHAQYVIGRTYQYLKRSGAMLESEADPKIKAAYERVLQDYPGCRAARAARSWLNYHQESKQGEQK